ncbi:hypothetical protein MUK42_33657 [Musa troglodytarum]|uniref:Uncharacterized protein n=1 Tax=Musa troglodytarum TaxID=320322 RepID=A0A9E7L0B8_9LILI|nr:hypothetical protein MUK42_33657 [Musa troglodytarum]
MLSNAKRLGKGPYRTFLVIAKKWKTKIRFFLRKKLLLISLDFTLNHSCIKCQENQVFLQSDIETVTTRMKHLFITYGKGKLVVEGDERIGWRILLVFGLTGSSISDAIREEICSNVMHHPAVEDMLLLNPIPLDRHLPHDTQYLLPLACPSIAHIIKAVKQIRRLILVQKKVNSNKINV